MTCAACKAAPKLRRRKCAFAGNGRFRSDNWMCETLGKLRDAALWNMRDDLHSGSLAVVLLPDRDNLQGYIVLSYYKSRGTVGAAVMMHDDKPPKVLTRSLAEAAARCFL